MQNYDHKKIEEKWHKIWEENNVNKTEDSVPGKENYYTLVEFPYPSGNLHVGHWYAFAVSDIYARFKRKQGFNVMFPIGFDAFGLPAENAAIKRNLNPKDWTYDNISFMKNQLKSMGASFDWDREVITCNPDYYKWTQWLFIQLFKNDLAYQADTTVNWCPSCKTVLANEQVVGGKCERCDSEVIQKDMRQWMLKITNYADKLVDDLDNLNWPEEIKQSQKNWIGRSEGAEIDFSLNNSEEKISIFTTRPDTLFGATYIVLAPEHKLISKLEIENKNEVDEYIQKTSKKSELERISDAGQKTGVEIKGVKAVNPVNGEEIPIFVADYVLVHYGTGAIMAVPAHDERDYDFAKKFNLEIKEVIDGGDISKEAYSGDGKLINSGEFNGLSSEDAKSKIAEKVNGKLTKKYKLRDWLISRQRYWGCPIPIIHCEKCGAVKEKEGNLPVELPEVENYLPSGDGKSPLAKNTDWVNTTCPNCGGNAERETDTFDTFIDSSWYFLRYTDPKNEKEFASKDKMKSWAPVNFYSGGAEHTTMHLLYSRFFTKALKDIGLVDINEPFSERLNRGLILGPDKNKMSKSKGNVIDPDEIVERLGADTVRMYLAFIGPYNEVGYYPWDPNGVVGVRRFLEKVWRLSSNLKEQSSENVTKELHRTIKKVTDYSGKLKFNTAISAMMIFINLAEKERVCLEDFTKFLNLLFPFAPHITEEINENIGNKEGLCNFNWPKYEDQYLVDDEIKIAVQINGKVRGEVTVSDDLSEDDVREMVLKNGDISKWLEGQEIKKFVYIKGRIISIAI